MVPGMTERERLAADLRRLEWLADAQLGPTRVSWPLARGGATALSQANAAGRPVAARDRLGARPRPAHSVGAAGLAGPLRTTADAAGR